VRETTDSGLPVAALYTADDVEGGLEGLQRRLGVPGEAPFTRGPYPTMYRGQLWTMRQFAGFGSPEETNERYHFLLQRGQTALSVAFDLPTQLGYDSADPLARAEVGRVGVAIDTADDMADLFKGLALDAVSVNFTINATAPIILATFLVAAERQGVGYEHLTGTLQNDILKEFMARKTFIFPPGPSMRLSCDVI
jgi:methylmalonyl-CoA mutase, N-terminal domain